MFTAAERGSFLKLLLLHGSSVAKGKVIGEELREDKKACLLLEKGGKKEGGSEKGEPKRKVEEKMKIVFVAIMLVRRLPPP